MKKILTDYGQYKSDIFQKLNFPFKKGKKILDVGCGTGVDCEIFIKIFQLETHGIDIYTDDNIKNIKHITFHEAGIYKIPYKNNTFDYIFLHDVLHHIDEKNQSYKKHIAGLKELERVVKKGGKIIIVEGNRYNPLFYPHMVKMRGHNHFRQSYFKKIVLDTFSEVEFKFFESHYYPPKFLNFWKVYEKVMDALPVKYFIAYNVAVIQKN